MNPANFLKTAHGDLAGLRELAFDYFNDTRRQMTGWMALPEAGNFKQRRDDPHHCKGGASLFGLGRVVALIGSYGGASVLEERGFDLTGFETELTEAGRGMMAMTD